MTVGTRNSLVLEMTVEGMLYCRAKGNSSHCLMLAWVFLTRYGCDILQVQGAGIIFEQSGQSLRAAAEP
jgi:hypothetical protein